MLMDIFKDILKSILFYSIFILISQLLFFKVFNLVDYLENIILFVLVFGGINCLNLIYLRKKRTSKS